MTEEAGETTRAVDRVVRLFVERRLLAERLLLAAPLPARPPQPGEPHRRFREPLLPVEGAGRADTTTHAPQRGDHNAR